MSDNSVSVSEHIKVEGVEGDWLHFGKNELGSEVYLRIDNITRIPAANVNICYFERMLSNGDGLNNEGDKSTIIRRAINFGSREFKDIEFTVFKQEMCMGAAENFKFDEQSEMGWVAWKKDSWDEFFVNVLEDANASINGVNLTNLNKLKLPHNTNKTERQIYGINRKADWIRLALLPSLFLIALVILFLVASAIDVALN